MMAGSLRRSSSNSIRIETRSGSRSARTHRRARPACPWHRAAEIPDADFAHAAEHHDPGCGWFRVLLRARPVKRHEIGDDIAAAPPQHDLVRPASQRPSLAQTHERDRLAATVEPDARPLGLPCQTGPAAPTPPDATRSGSPHWSRFRSRWRDRRRRPAGHRQSSGQKAGQDRQDGERQQQLDQRQPLLAAPAGGNAGDQPVAAARVMASPPAQASTPRA